MNARYMPLAVLALLLAGPALAQGVTGSVETGVRAVSTDASTDRAAEYRSTLSGGALKLDLAAQTSQVYFSLTSSAEARNDQQTRIDLELERTVRSHTTYTALPHRLEHDPLANLRGTVKEIVATWSTDVDPASTYGIDFKVLANRTELQFDGAGWLTVALDYREQWREGHRQSMALSHCSTCHVESKGRQVDEHTRDGGVSARATFGRWSISGAYSERDFRERGATPTRVYELAEQPALRRPLFNDRVIYDARDGALPYDMVPATAKKTTRFEVASSGAGGFAVSLASARSTVTNTDTGNEAEFQSVRLLLSHRLGKRASLQLRARSYSIDSSDYYVDIYEPAAVAGTYPGKTYRERYGFDPDFLRQSAIDRDVVEAQARFLYRPSRRSSLSATYDVRDIDRESYQVAPGETSTLEQKLKLSYLLRPAPGLQLRAAATLADISHPFAIVDAACNPTALQTTPVSSPLAPGSIQYYQIHDARVADLAASPSRFAEIRLTGSYQLSPSSLASLSYQWWDGKNSDGDLGDWSKTITAVTAMMTLAPSDGSELYAGASYRKRELEQHTCIPLMDG